jgi:nitronate monooxygenase
MIETRLTERLGLAHPILSAPMAFAAGGRLAAAVTAAGGLGLIGGGYGDAGWVEQAFAAAGNARVGCGFITWRLAERPEAFEAALDHAPAAMMLSFGDPAPYAPRLAAEGVPMIAQVQRLRDAAHAADLGAAIIVAQGAEAGGHGERRATLTLVPEVADWLARNAPDTLLLAAGGIADGRGLAAALMLGADGVLVGSRLWASEEAEVPPAMHAAAVAATGDETIRSTVMDVARGLDWPARYSCRVLRNPFTDRWHDDVEALRAAADTEGPRWSEAFRDGDPERSNTFVGEATGLIRSVRPARAIIADMVAEAEALLAGGWRRRP